MIQIDIDMPKSCFECDKTYKWKKDGKVQCSHINMPSISSNTTNRPSYCPLKEVPSGKWIPVFQGDEIIDYRCSCCEFGNTFGKGTVGMNYCPRCGSRNEVEE